MNRLITTVLWLLVSGLLSSAVAQTLAWDYDYGGEGLEQAYDIVTIHDSSHILVGYIDSQDATGKNLLLVKIDKNGELQWSKSFGGVATDWGLSIEVTSDSSIVFAGFSSSFSPSAQLYILKADFEGILDWSRVFGGLGADYGYSVVEGDDSAYVVAGETYSFGSGLSDVYVTKVTANGTQLWTKFYGGAGYDWASKIEKTADGGFIVTGYTNSFGSGNYDVYLLRLDPDGDTIWTSTHGSSTAEGGKAVVELPTGDFVVAGVAYRGIPRGNDAYLVGFGADGQFQWETALGGSSDESFNDVMLLPNNKLIGVGATTSSGRGANDFLYVKVDLLGDSLTATTFGGLGDDNARALSWADDEGVVLAGYSTSFGKQEQVYVVRADHDFLCGDMNGNGSFAITDAVYLIGYVFGEGPAPFPLRSADGDCSGSVNMADAVALIGWIFGETDPPCETCEPPQ